MTHCQECDSEVADTDIFCPFCGISMEPVGVANQTADAFESTVVMSLTDITADSEMAAENVVVDDEADAATLPESAPAEAPSVGVAAGFAFDEVDEIVKNESFEETASIDETIAQDEPEKAVVTEVTPPPEPETPSILADISVAFDSTPSDGSAAAEEIGVSPITDEAAAPAGNLSTDAAPDAEVQAAGDGISETSEIQAESEQPVIEDVSISEHDSSANQSLMLDEDSETAAGDETEHASIGDKSSSPVEDIYVGLAPALEVESSSSPEATVDITSSGEISGDDNRSFTTPNLEPGNTDGRGSGLKPLSEGTLLNARYEIVRKIGGGGMGAVYLAFDQNLGGTPRAVKEMVQSHIEEAQQAKAIEDFKRESMILSTLDHPAIPTIYDYFYDEPESRFYLVMKYISGGDLSAQLRSAPEGRIDESMVTEWATQIIDVLHYLHSLPTTIVYRDLKPSNVMIDGNTARIMLVDFGIARSINQSQEKGVTAVGTMGYAPPELFSGQVEPRSDIYSLGSTMFHLLTGADPQNNPLLIFDFQKNPRPRQINPRLSDQIERILMRAVEYNAESRFSSAIEMKFALQQHLEDLKNGRVTYGEREAPAAVSLANQNVFCGFCGQRIIATDYFCAFCGSKQPLAQQGVHSEIYASRSTTTAKLVIDGTSELDTPAYALGKNENLVGRRDPMSNIFPEVDLSKWDPQTKISRRHAKIWRDGNSFLVEDLGSSNGTLLLTSVSEALRLAPHSPHPLANGDRIRVGDTTLQFIVG